MNEKENKSGNESKNQSKNEITNEGRSENRNRKDGGRVQKITQGAVIAAVYVVMVLLFDSISFGPVQFRIAEAMTILPAFTAAAVPGLFVGCLISNILGGATVLDIVFGSLATLIGAAGTYLLRRHRWLAPIPPIAANTIIVPFILKYAYGYDGMLWYFMLTVGAGEILSCYVLGELLWRVLHLRKGTIFHKE